jgi:hypothetical protein
MTRPDLDALTFDERLRVASGRPVRSLEARIIDAALEPYRKPDPDADGIVRANRAGDRRRRPVPAHLLAEPAPPPPPGNPGPDSGARSLADELVRDEARARMLDAGFGAVEHEIPARNTPVRSRRLS